MKYFYLYVFGLICFIVAVSYYNTLNNSLNIGREGFNDTTRQTLVLLGDSILQNDAFVGNGKSVTKLLQERNNGETITLALNNTKILDVYSQIGKIPTFDNTKTTIFLSIGGNDILDKYVENNEPDNNTLDTIFTAYKTLVKSIKDKFPNARIVLFDIYYPDSIKYKQYYNIIGLWNSKLYKFALKNDYDLFKVSSILTKPEDFSLDIEPSALGSKKLVDGLGVYL